jgi:putative transposase
VLRPLRGPAVGVDKGAKSLAVLSTGEVAPNSKHLSRHARRMAWRMPRLQRQFRAGPATVEVPAAFQGQIGRRSRRGGPDPYRRVAQAHRPPGHEARSRAHRGPGCPRRHRQSQRLRRLRGKTGLNRVVLYAAAGLHPQLAYQKAPCASALVAADLWYPSSKTCSRGKTVKAEPSLSKRSYRCEHCEQVTDRHLSAAANLASLTELVTPVGTETGAGEARESSRGRGRPRTVRELAPLLLDGRRRWGLRRAGQDPHRHPATGGSETVPLGSDR